MSVGSSQPFRPAGTASLSASITTANVALTGGGDSVLVTNAASGIAFVRFGTDMTVAATSADTPVPAGARLLLGVNPLITTAAAILASGSGAIFFTRGDGSIY
jgi:hypothetical protein